jgi:hypothetical protein
MVFLKNHEKTLLPNGALIGAGRFNSYVGKLNHSEPIQLFYKLQTIIYSKKYFASPFEK